jgi:hypothetical protein
MVFISQKTTFIMVTAVEASNLTSSRNETLAAYMESPSVAIPSIGARTFIDALLS